MNKNVLITLSCAVVIVQPLFNLTCTRNNPAPHYDIIAPQTAAPFIHLTGTVTVPAFDISIGKDGKIAALFVNIDDTVAAGDTLATLDNQEELGTLARCNSELAVEQLHLQQCTTTDRVIAEQKVIQARSEVEMSRKRLERKRAALIQGTISQSEFDEMEAQHTQSESASNIAESELASLTTVQSALLQQKIHQAELKLEAASFQLTQTIVKAPYSGIVSRVNGGVGSFYKKGTVIIEIAKEDTCNRIIAEFSMNETSFIFKQGQNVVVRNQSGIKKRALIQRFRQWSKEGKTLVELHLLLTDTTSHCFTSGSFFTADITGDTLTNAIVTSTPFIDDCDNRTCVHIKHGNRSAVTAVRCGSASDGRVIIYDGVVAGDTLVAQHLPSSR